MPRFFANASRSRDEILDGVNGSRPPTQCVILNVESVHDIDSTGAPALFELLEVVDDEVVSLVLSGQDRGAR